MIITPRLFLAKKNHAEFDEFGADIIQALTGNINFPVTEPDLLTVTAKHAQYHTAINAATGGTSAQRIVRDDLRKEFHVMITNLAYDVASRSNGNLAVYVTSGFDYRRPPVPKGDPGSAPNFHFEYNENEGELVSKHGKAANALMYELWLGTTPVPPASGGGTPTPGPTPGGWAKVSETTTTKVVLTGLTSGTRYYGYVITKGRKNKSSAPSNIATKICP